MTKKKKLEEATVTGGYDAFGNGIVGDDDFPSGNIIFGHKYNKESVPNRLTGAYPNLFVDETDWKWDIFIGTKGMQDKANYSNTLDSFNKPNSPIKDDIWKRVKLTNRDHKWVPEKEALREPEQKGNELRKDNENVPKNPATGEDDDKIIKKMNKHLQQEK
jgi:hypothetical protein